MLLASIVLLLLPGSLSAAQASQRPAPVASPAQALPANALPVHPDVTAEMMGLKPDAVVKSSLAWQTPNPVSVFSLAFSPDGKRLAVGGYNTVTLWNCETGKPELAPLKLNGAVLSLAFSPDGKTLAIGGGVAGRSAFALLFTPETGAKTVLEGHTDTVYSIVFAPNGESIATSSHDKTARIWNTKTGKERFQLKGHGEAVTGVAYSGDGKFLYTACMDRSVRRFDADTGTLLRTLSGHDKGINCILPHPDGKRLISVGEEPRLRWWNLERGEVERDDYGHNEAVTALVMSADKRRIASVSGDHHMIIWREGGGYNFSEEDAKDWLYAVAFRPNSKLVASAGAEGLIRLYETDDRRLRLTLLTIPTPSDKTEPLKWLSVTPEGFFDGSPQMTKSVSLFANGLAIKKIEVSPWSIGDSVLKAWKNEKLEPAKWKQPTPAVTPK